MNRHRLRESRSRIRQPLQHANDVCEDPLFLLDIVAGCGGNRHCMPGGSMSSLDGIADGFQGKQHGTMSTTVRMARTMVKGLSSLGRRRAPLFNELVQLALALGSVVVLVELPVSTATWHPLALTAVLALGVGNAPADRSCRCGFRASEMHATHRYNMWSTNRESSVPVTHHVNNA